MHQKSALDPVFASDREGGSTLPETGEEALLEGGSFDGLGVPVADDTDSAERPE